MNDQYRALFKVDTADIYDSIVEKWPGVNKDFVKYELENQLISTLHRKKIFCNPTLSSESKQGYIQKTIERLNHWNKAIAKSEGAFPFMDCFIVNNKGQDEILNYNESCELQPDDPDYMIFFTLKVSIIDVLKLRRFLVYHFLTSFNKNRSKLKRFLEDIVKKYDGLLSNKQIAELAKAITDLEIRRLQVNPVVFQGPSVDEKEKEATLHTKVLATYYMLQKLGCNRSTADLADMARFVAFLTGKQSSAEIGGTNIYKFLADPFKSSGKTDKRLLNNLQIVREYFETLNLQALADLVSNDISARTDV